MLIRPHDAAQHDQEWRAFLRAHDFGQLIAAGAGRALPVVVPTHFVYDGEATILLHLARPNPVWTALAENPQAIMAVVGAYTYIPTDWNAEPGQPPEYGIPTSYYAAVQASGPCTVVDDPAPLAAILQRQLAHFQPGGGYAAAEPGDSPFGRRLGAIRGLRLEIAEVRAKFKFGGNKQAPQQLEIAARLDQRAGPRDDEARRHLLDRLARSR